MTTLSLTGHGVSSTRRVGAPLRTRSLLAAAAPAWLPPIANWGQLVAEATKPLFDATNAFRMAHGGQQPYAYDPLLEKSIQWKVMHECAGGNPDKQYMAHDDPFQQIGDQPPCPRGWYDRISATGYNGGHPGFQGAAAENLLYGAVDLSAQSMEALAARFIQMWTSAGPGEGHYDNIVANWGAPPAMGVAVAIASNGLVFAGQDFGTTASGAPVEPPVPDPTPVPPPPPPPPGGPAIVKGGIWRNKAKHAQTVQITRTLQPGDKAVYYHVLKSGLDRHMAVARFRDGWEPRP